MALPGPARQTNARILVRPGDARCGAALQTNARQCKDFSDAVTGKAGQSRAKPGKANQGNVFN
jgi:hypothetical protein